MSASRAKGTRNSRHIALHPFCIYCGGGVAGTQIDHVPPIAVYTLRRRPEGLEFTACAPCHEGTRKLDAVAAFFSRLYPDPSTEEGKQEVRKLYSGMVNAVPEIGAEIDRNLNRTADYQHARLMSDALGIGQPIRVFGPWARRYFDAFSARVALALHYQVAGSALPLGGQINVRSLTNTGLTRGDLPEGMLESMGDFWALAQKGLEAQKDFAFKCNLGRDDSETMSFFRLRQSMGAVAFCFATQELQAGEGLTVFTPGFLQMPIAL